MPKTLTTSRGYVVPLLGEPGNVPADLERLAVAVAADLTGVETRVARNEVRDSFATWAWGGVPYDWTTSTGNWAEPPGAKRTLALRAGHLYRMASRFSGVANPGTIIRYSIWAGTVGGAVEANLMEDEQHGSGHLRSFYISGSFRPTATGNANIFTRIAVNAPTRVLRQFQSPTTTLTDYGWRAA